MKNVLILILTATTAVLSMFCIAQRQTASRQTAQVDSLRTELTQKYKQIEDLQAWKKGVDAQRSSLLAPASDPSTRLLRQMAAAQAAAQATTNAAAAAPNGEKTDKNPLGQLVSKMMADPEMKKFIQDQQRVMMDTMYGPMFKKMGLTPEETDKLKEFMLENQMKATEKATALMGSGATTNRAEAMMAINADQKAFDAQLKEMLGDARYAEYKDYQQTVSERTQLNLFRQQNAGANALNDQQAEQLLQIMSEEKKAAAASGLLAPSSGRDQANLEAMLSDNGADKLMQSQETLNQRVYERAKTVLASEQLDSFNRFQSNQLQTMRMGVNMARKMFVPDKSADNSAPPNP
jgi:hypothetical protein